MADGGFNVEPTDTIASIGSMAVFKCSPPYSNPPANVHWLRDNDTVITITSSTKYIQADSGNLYIMDIVNDDEGYYQCVASNTVTDEVSYSTKVYLSVIGENNNCLSVGHILVCISIHISKYLCRQCKTSNLLQLVYLIL